MKFLQNVDKLEDFLMTNVQKEKKDVTRMYIVTVRQFRDVVNSCFGKKVSPNFKEDISRFCSSYRKLGICDSESTHCRAAHN